MHQCKAEEAGCQAQVVKGVVLRARGCKTHRLDAELTKPLLGGWPAVGSSALASDRGLGSPRLIAAVGRGGPGEVSVQSCVSGRRVAELRCNRRGGGLQRLQGGLQQACRGHQQSDGHRD